MVLFYKRIFATPRFHLVANIFIVVVVGWVVSAFFVGFSPVEQSLEAELRREIYSHARQILIAGKPQL